MGRKKMKIKKNSFLRDSLFWYIVIITLFWFGMIFWGIAKADNHDLSGKTYPIPVVKQDGVEFTETTSKVEKVLDKIAKADKDTKVYYDKITTIQPKDAANQYCYVKVVIKQSGNNLIKEEILECADGRRTVDGPSYWELFAQFYYRDVTAPEYCRVYSRPNHVFKSFGKTCLKQNGEWEVK
jgi:hypothetical protein